MEKITPERIAEVIRKLENMEAGCIPAAISLIRDLAHDRNNNAVGIGALKAMKEERDALKGALLDIISERGEEYGDCDYQSLWKAIEGAKKALK